MYCSKCGTEIIDNAKFCPKCGVNLGKNGSEPEYTQNHLKKKNHLNIKVLGIILIIFIVLIGFFACGSKFADDIALKATKAYFKGNIDKYYDLLSEPYKTYMVGKNGWFKEKAEFKQELYNSFEDWQREIIGSCGDDYSLEFSVRDITEYEDTEIFAAKRELERDFGYEPEKIKSIAIVKIGVGVTGARGGTSIVSEVVCIKIGGSWYVHRPELESL